VTSDGSAAPPPRAPAAEPTTSPPIGLRDVTPPRLGIRAAFALAAAAGASWALAAPPRGWWPLLPVGVALLAVALRGHGVQRRLLSGATAGAVLYGSTLPWLLDFSSAGYVALVLLETALLAGAAAATARWWTLPAVLVLLEAVQARFPFGGFPLPGLVYSQPGGPFALAAPLGGALLVLGLSATAGAALAALAVVSPLRRRLASGVALAAVTAGPLAAGAAVTTAPAGSLDAAVVQGGGPRGTRAVFTDPDDVTARHLAVLDTALDPVGAAPDLLVLPEGVVVVDGAIGATPDSAVLALRARRLESALVVGVVEGEQDGFRNVAVAYSADGRLVDRYEKEHRVPFGEYIPARGLVSKLTDATSLVPKDAIVGEGTALLRLPQADVGVVISYEIFFADRVREAVRAGGQILVVPTNASSYVGDEVPATEVAAAQLRAREYGRAVLQAAPTGYSAVVMPDGRVTAQTDLGAAQLLRETVPLRRGLTPYARVGDLPVLALALAIAGLPLGLARRDHHGAEFGGSRVPSGTGDMPSP
jgi:apolipoprotein N-acyltransferase